MYLDIERKIVLPGEEISLEGMKQGNGIYHDSGKFYSYQMGVLQTYNSYANVIPLSGKYYPVRNDRIIGKVIDIAPSFWIMDIRGPYPGFLHINDTPWKNLDQDLNKILGVGDTVFAKVNEITESRQIWLSLKDAGLRKLEGGHIIMVQPTKVSRIIGKGGSMVNTIKEVTGVKIQLGQNGVVWLDGSAEKVMKVRNILKFIEKEAHTSGLTDRVKKILEENR
ncbi:MAG: exosome complex RNA-binding protein Rrp4 [Candidatus Thermoplasmatota archaeon]|jgi:exosome complex component RRP4|nr:exosome complex RNA-binding protein Rrp4 [Candidatus Thermoplasmatota archaeon]